MLNTSSTGGIYDIFALADLALETAICQPVISYAENPVRTLEDTIKLDAVVHIARDQFCAQRSQFLCNRLVRIACQGANLPPVCQKFSCHRSTLLTCRTGDCNQFVVHFIFLFSL